METGGFWARRACLLIGVVLTGFLAIDARGADDIYGVQARFANPPGSQFQLFSHLKDDSSVLNTGFIFDPLGGAPGGVYGAAFKGGVFNGIELDNGFVDNYLITIPTVGTAFRTRVGGPIGFSHVEALACIGTSFIGADVDGPGHHTNFISIDATTGIGTQIGEGSTDVMIFGLAYDPIAGVLYGAGKANATVSGNNLYTINPATGATTFIGPMGPVIQSLTFTETLGLVGAFENLYSINTTTGAATMIGTTNYLGLAAPGAGNGFYALAAPAPSAPVVATPFAFNSIWRDASQIVHFTWESETGFNFQIECSPTMAPGSWVPIGGLMSGTAGEMMYDTGTPVSGDQFYRVIKSVP